MWSGSSEVSETPQSYRAIKVYNTKLLSFFFHMRQFHFCIPMDEKFCSYIVSGMRELTLKVGFFLAQVVINSTSWLITQLKLEAFPSIRRCQQSQLEWHRRVWPRTLRNRLRTIRFFGSISDCKMLIYLFKSWCTRYLPQLSKKKGGGPSQNSIKGTGNYNKRFLPQWKILLAGVFVVETLLVF